MKVFVVGADGFLGRNISDELSRHHDVYRGVRRPSKYLDDDGKRIQIDLKQKDSIKAAIRKVVPQVIINCAGIVDPNSDVSQNLLFTRNILESIHESSVDVEKVIISGSAGEYGSVRPQDLPVPEEAPLAAISEYGLSKIHEVEFAKEFAKKNSINLIEARIFNPIGPGMHGKFLISRLLDQIREIKDGARSEIEINRLDASRDYVDVRDVARAIRFIIERPTRFSEYNIGSGVATTNQALIEKLLKHSDVERKLELREISPVPESTVASQADISRIVQDIGWEPQISIDDTISDIVKESENGK